MRANLATIPEHCASFANIWNVYSHSSFQNISHWPQKWPFVVLSMPIWKFLWLLVFFIYLLKIKCEICTGEFSGRKITYTQNNKTHPVELVCALGAVYICFGQLKSRIIIRKKVMNYFQMWIWIIKMIIKEPNNHNKSHCACDCIGVCPTHNIAHRNLCDVMA